MTRTQEQILSEINAEADKNKVLANLQTNHSRASVWQYIKQIVAFSIHTLEVLYENYRADIQTVIEKKQVGTTAWYAEQSLAFQMGHKLLLINNIPTYAEDNPSARIIAHVAIEEGTTYSTKGTIFAKSSKSRLQRLLP